MHARADPLRLYSTGLLAGAAGDPGVPAQAWAAHAEKEGVVGLLLDLPALQLPALAPQRQALREVAREVAVREMAAQVVTRQVLSLLDTAGIPVLVLKGRALAYWLYREPWHRPSADLDVLVPDKAVARQAVAVLRAAGYELVAGVGPDASDGFEVALHRGSGIAVDLHWRLLNTAVLERHFSWPELDAQARPLPSLAPGARGLGKVHALFHALLHRVTNLAKGDGDRLIWLYDIHLLAGACDAQAWREFVVLCADKGIATLCLDGLRAARGALGSEIPDGVEVDLAGLAEGETWQLDDIDQGAVDRSHLHALPWPQKVAWLRHKLLPSPEFMRYRYGVDGRWMLAKAYLGRWLLALRSAFGGRLG